MAKTISIPVAMGNTFNIFARKREKHLAASEISTRK